MILNETGYTYGDFSKLLSSSERDLMLKMFEIMTDDNLVYLYQTVSRRDNRRYIDKISEELDITIKRVQNMLSAIVGKQSTDRYFMYRTKSGINGEYFINPYLAIKGSIFNDVIYKNIIPKLEVEARLTHM